MLEKLAAVEARYNELMELLGSPGVTSNPELLMKYGQEQANLEPMVSTYQRYREVLTQRDEAQGMLSDDVARIDLRVEIIIQDGCCLVSVRGENEMIWILFLKGSYLC